MQNDAGECIYSVTFLTRENTFRSRPEEARLAPSPWAMTMLTSRGTGPTRSGGYRASLGITCAQHAH